MKPARLSPRTSLQLSCGIDVPNWVCVRLDKVVRLPRSSPTANPAENTKLPESRISPEKPAAFSPLNIAQWVETAKLVPFGRYGATNEAAIAVPVEASVVARATP